MSNEQTQKELELEIAELKEQLEYKKEKLERLKFINTNGRYFLNWDGGIHEMIPTVNDTAWKNGIKQGNVFKTRKDAEKERDRRALLYEFNQFKNERNNGWSPNWHDCYEVKHCITFVTSELLKVKAVYVAGKFSIFGYFKDYQACFDAIEKFGDRIKKLYID